MINKNDPLIAAVQQVMQNNQAERDAVNLVNEKLGVVDRRALPRERQGEWDSAYQSLLKESDDMGPVKKKNKEAKEYEHKKSGKTVVSTKPLGKEWKLKTEELHGDQPKLDVNKNGKIDSHDLKLKRMGLEEDQLDEREMSSAEKGKEEKLKAKYDASGMKASMKKQYGDEKGKDIYFAKIRKMAMEKKKKLEEGFNNRHDLSKEASVEEQVVAVLNEDDIDSYENRMTAGLGQQFTPYGGGRFGGGTAKRTRVGSGGRVRIDNPRITNTRTGEQTIAASGPKNRKRLIAKRKTQPPGTLADRAQKLSQAGQQAQQARAKIDSHVSATQGTSTLAAGAARRPADQSAPSMRQQGSMLPPPKSSGVLKRGGAALAAGAAGFTATQVGNEPPAASAGNKKETWPGQGRTGKIGGPLGTKYDERVPQEPQGGITKQSKIVANPRNVSAAEIVKDKDYQTNLAKVGGEGPSRKMAVGTQLDNLGTLEKGQSIWSKTKEKLAKTAVPGFEMGNTKGGAGR